jgi:GMP synthase-like glutamine amidotransferase
MTTGLLLCDHLDPDVAEVVGDYTDLFPAAFGPAGIPLRVYDVTRGELPASVDECDAWIVSGSRRSVYEDEGWIRDLHDVAHELVLGERPVAGICFGHQLIARTLGGTVERAEVGWGVGVREFRLVAPLPADVAADGPAPDTFAILTSHRDQVIELPEGAELVATADYCPVGAYRIGDHVLCVQGHPEWVPELSRLLVQRRRADIGDETSDAALASLERPLDHGRVVSWMAAVLRRGRPPTAG